MLRWASGAFSDDGLLLESVMMGVDEEVGELGIRGGVAHARKNKGGQKKKKKAKKKPVWKEFSRPHTSGIHIYI